MLTVAVPSLPPPRMLSRWILIVWWGVAALSSVGHLVFFNLVDGDDFTWWGPIFVQFVICTAWALVTPLAFRIARDLGDDVRPARIVRAIAWGLMLSAAMSTSRAFLHGFEHPAGVVCSASFTQIADYMTLDLPLFAAVLAAGLARRYLLQREAQQARAAAIEVQLAESRLHALQMQLNPHFLFNTLNTISALVESDPAATRTVVARLSELLRRTLDVAQQPEVRLAEELQFIRGYLEIMKHRFSDRLTTSFAIEDGLDDALVPAFVLQPLVENAIEHGIGRIRGLGAIELRIERCGDRLHITVRDNGPGLDRTALPFGSAASPGKAGLVDPTAPPFGSAASPGKAGLVDPTALPFGSAASPGKAGLVGPTALPFGSAASPGKAGLVDPTARDGIGLSNTAARLAQLYPGRSALRLADDRERGAVAVVELPYRTLDEEAGA